MNKTDNLILTTKYNNPSRTNNLSFLYPCGGFEIYRARKFIETVVIQNAPNYRIENFANVMNQAQ